MENYYIILEIKKDECTGELFEEILTDYSGKAMKFNNLVDAKDYIFHLNINSAIIFKRASILINTNGYDPTK
jgi:hypothetical protein